ncbi:hypothetical protein CNE_BB2p03850 (plasmid) [Cupriavidus necator N-1]|uniref:Type IV pilus biogenesis protein PilP n=1 Tax=Cupriavidus necator (strain ATCC 43291 / DSM 13513 / CCUG 52238 / LMG 8453 / N-1) TaxID=1042878 RepID=F8GY54_CUPNN|nr:hypothetical protein [Cupriavidus necator]AEI83178.1 hypothetical protein CNE_BB2p03850 [Cupriavidus necator N-1]MDX6008590.1 hypothetical protein [Cupriavidus necator]
MRATPFPLSFPLRRAAVAAFALLVAGPVLADDDKSLTQKLIDADAKVALQKLQQELDKGAPPPAVSAAPTGAAAKPAAERAPQTIALYGVDGRSAGGGMTLRSYVRWGDQVYPAKVGAKWRGYIVSAITESGTTFTRGKARVFAPLVQDDAAVLVDTPQTGSASTAARTGPLPNQGMPTGQGTPPFFPLPPIGPAPGAASVPTPPPTLPPVSVSAMGAPTALASPPATVAQR